MSYMAQPGGTGYHCDTYPLINASHAQESYALKPFAV
jgi:hypothetical protein